VVPEFSKEILATSLSENSNTIGYRAVVQNAAYSGTVLEQKMHHKARETKLELNNWSLSVSYYYPIDEPSGIVFFQHFRLSQVEHRFCWIRPKQGKKRVHFDKDAPCECLRTCAITYLLCSFHRYTCNITCANVLAPKLIFMDFSFIDETLLLFGVKNASKPVWQT